MHFFFLLIFFFKLGLKAITVVLYNRMTTAIQLDKIKKGEGVSIYVRNKYKSPKLYNLSGIYLTFESCAVILKVNPLIDPLILH